VPPSNGASQVTDANELPLVVTRLVGASGIVTGVADATPPPFASIFGLLVPTTFVVDTLNV